MKAKLLISLVVAGLLVAPLGYAVADDNTASMGNSTVVSGGDNTMDNGTNDTNTNDNTSTDSSSTDTTTGDEDY